MHTMNVGNMTVSTMVKIADMVADELGNWRPARNKFTSTYFKEYHKHVRRSEPVEDYDERNALYAM